jgi:hypothetical protein
VRWSLVVSQLQYDTSSAVRSVRKSGTAPLGSAAAVAARAAEAGAALRDDT